MIYFANRGLKFVVNANRVCIVNIYLAVFDLVFVLDLSSKSTFAQNESCRSSFSLQLLFWPNFKFLYENLSFNWSNSGKNQLSEETVSSLCSSPAIPATVLVGAPPRVGRRRSSHAALRVLIRSRCRLRFRFAFLLPRVRVTQTRARARRRPSRRPTLATPLRFLAPRAARPHPETTPPFPDLGRPHPEPNRARRPRPPLPFFAELRPSPSTTLFWLFSA